MVRFQQPVYSVGRKTRSDCRCPQLGTAWVLLIMDSSVYYFVDNAKRQRFFGAQVVFFISGQGEPFIWKLCRGLPESLDAAVVKTYLVSSGLGRSQGPHRDNPPCKPPGTDSLTNRSKKRHGSTEANNLMTQSPLNRQIQVKMLTIASFFPIVIYKNQECF